jgi:sulfatase maturation enzyme AslB (radical SAM superfamily)
LDLDNFDDKIDFARAESIGFRGGEPLLSPANFKILEKLIKHRNFNCFINFQTNGGVELSQRQKDILSNFTNVNMSFSIDGVGPVFEYMRYPLKWSLLLKNIDYCRSNNILVSACYTLSNVNLIHHEETCAWFDQNEIRYILNLVYYPNYFRPSALPKLVKDQILTQQKTSQLADVLATHTPQDDRDYTQFQLEIARQDLWKGIQMQDYLPKLQQLLG